jgi:hypothetical protein
MKFAYRIFSHSEAGDPSSSSQPKDDSISYQASQHRPQRRPVQGFE